MNKFGFFDFNPETDNGTAGDAYRYTASEFAEVLSGIASNGVNPYYGNKFAATANALVVTLSTGAVWINGHYGINDTTSTYTFSSANAGRKDAIMAHLDEENRKMEIVTVAGTTSAYPAAPDGNYVPLFYVSVKSDGTLNVNDCRSYSTTPSAKIVYSATQPTTGEIGQIWLKPV